MAAVEKEGEKSDAAKSVMSRQELLAEGSVSLMLNTYDDIFSDFDPRPYHRRAMSEDFLNEARRAVRDREGGFELRFLVPKAKRNISHEIMIRQRLREHFKRHVGMLEQDVRAAHHSGLLLIGIGIVMMFITILVYSKVIALNPIAESILIVITEPAGWFLFWIGGERLVYEKRRFLPELTFYRKMSRAEISFVEY